MVGLFISIIAWVAALFPMITFPVDTYTEYVDIAFDVLDGIFFFLPTETVFAVLGIFVALQSIRITIATIKAVWDLLPLA